MTWRRTLSLLVGVAACKAELAIVKALVVSRQSAALTRLTSCPAAAPAVGAYQP